MLIKLNNIQKRFILFLGLCIPIRIMISYVAKEYTNVNFNGISLIKLLGYLALFPVLGWLYIMFISPRDTGPETFGGKIWWGYLRPIHILLYIIFIILALSDNKKNNSNAWIALLIDVIVGLLGFIIYHKNAGNI